MSKRICILPVMDPKEDEYFLYAVDSVINSVDYLLFSVNERSWGNPDIKLTDESRKYFQELVQTNPKFKLMIGYWGEEHEQHNAGIAFADSLDCDIIFCTSCDQIYGEGDPKKIMDILENSDSDVIRAQWLTFWKTDPLCIIQPPEPFHPVLAYKTKKFKYLGVSEGRPIDSKGKTLTLTTNDVGVFHFSFARSDEFMKKKMDMSSHKHEMMPGWYENVWLKWKLDDKNLHPCWPGQYVEAQPFSLDRLPKGIRAYFQMIQQKKNWTGLRK